MKERYGQLDKQVLFTCIQTKAIEEMLELWSGLKKSQLTSLSSIFDSLSISNFQIKSGKNVSRFTKKTGQDVQLLYYSLDVCRLPWARASASVIVTIICFLGIFWHR